MQPPQTQLVIPQWLALSMPVRLHLKKVFGIPRSEGTNVVDGHVVSDGHTHPDLARITPEAMEAYLGLERVPGHIPVFHELFAMTLEKAESEIAPPPSNNQVGKLVPDLPPKPITLNVGGKTFIAVEVTPTTEGITIYPDDLHGGWNEQLKDLPVDNTTTTITIPEDKPAPKKRAPRKAK